PSSPSPDGDQGQKTWWQRSENRPPRQDAMPDRLHEESQGASGDSNRIRPADVMMRARTRQQNNASLAGPVGSRGEMGNRPHPNAYGDREVLRYRDLVPTNPTVRVPKERDACGYSSEAPPSVSRQIVPGSTDGVS